MADIYHDNGKARGLRTRDFRDAKDGGVEWRYADDPESRWYALHPGVGTSIEEIKKSGFIWLSRYDNGSAFNV